MTILFFSRLFYPHIGGVEKHVLEISKLMVADGHRVTVVTELPEQNTNIQVYQYSSQSAKKYETYQGIDIYRIKVGKEGKLKKFRIWQWLWHQRKLIQEADVVHCHDVFFWFLPFRFLYPRRPVYTTFHGYETGTTISIKATIVRKISENLSLGNICVGEFIEKWYGTKATYVTYGGVNVERVSSIKYQVLSSPLKITFIGRLEKDTGVEIYLKALDELKKNSIKFIFEAFGDGTLRKQTEAYGKVYGFVENPWEFAEKTNIIFASSYLSILEALYQKKFVFAVDQNVLKRDYLEMTPFRKWITINQNPQKIAEYIAMFLQDPQAKNTELASASTWAGTQTWDTVKNLYYKLWKNER